jgi:cytochrome b561
MALPLAACVAIWGIGDASVASVAWLPVLHKVIATSALAWTALRFILRQRGSGVSAVPPHLLERASLILLYALLALQPVLALAGSMLHGSDTTMFGFAVPSILPVNQPLALRIVHLHGWNAVLLLAMVVMHIVAALRKVRYRSS